MKSHILFLLLVFFLFAVQAGAQEFGEISEEDFTMTGIDGYPELDAVVLFKNADFTFDREFGLTIKHHTRIKILTEKGKDLASVKIPYYYENKIFNLEAASYDMEGKEYELDSDNIFEEGSKIVRQKVFAIPGVEVGSIIEYTYTIYTKFISNLEPWFFQGPNYIKSSRVSILLPHEFAYNVMEKNMGIYDIKATQRKELDVVGGGAKLTRFIWTAHDMPPIRPEPYMRAPDDYYAQLLFQLLSYKDNYNSLKFAKTWGQVTKGFQKKYGDYIDDNDLDDKVNELIAGKTIPMEKARALYDFVREKITTSDRKWFFRKNVKDPEEVVKSEAGSPTEKNTLLMNMLKLAGFDPHPVLISTRGNGDFNPDWKQIQQFNRALINVKVGKKSYFLDTSHKYAPFGVLPSFLKVGLGLMITDNEPRIVNIKLPRVRNKKNIESQVAFDTDGVMHVKSHLSFTGEEALDARRSYGDTLKRRKRLEKLIHKISEDAKLDTFYVHNLNNLDNEFGLDIEYHVDGYIKEDSGLKYFKPPFLTAMNENKFKSPKRYFPVDFGYKDNYSEAIELTLPKGLTAELPGNTIKRMRAMLFAENYFVDEGTLQCKRIFKILKKEVPQKDYIKLRDAYNAIVEADQNEISLVSK